MFSFTIEDVCNLFSVPPSGKGEINNISSDSRKIGKGDLFIPLKGEKFDGHDYIEKAIESGAILALADEEKYFSMPQVIPVEDTLKAYHKLAAFYREKFDIPVVAITGSNGKTTVKDITYAILSSKMKTLRTAANFNNEIGVPQTLMQLDPSYKALVIELGMRGKGQIAQLASIVQPNIAVITMIGESHFELLGSYEAIADAKAEICDYIRPNGFLLLNSEDRFTPRIAKKAHSEILTFGTTGDMKIVEKSMDPAGGFRAVFEFRGERVEAKIPFPGEHNVYNSAVALLVGAINGISLAEGVEALKNAALTSGRMQLRKMGNLTVVDDCYNASPSSMKSALRWFWTTYSDLPRVLVLGDMKELGAISYDAHKDIGKFAASIHPQRIFFVGSEMEAAYIAAIKAGAYASIFKDSESAIPELLKSVPYRAALLVKGSRAMHLEKVVEALEQRKRK